VPSHRGALILLQRADDVRAEIIAPFGAVVAHLLSLLSCFRAAARGVCLCGAGQYPEVLPW
jgi:hypothetical protein